MFGCGLGCLVGWLVAPLALEPTMFWTDEQRQAFAKADKQWVEIRTALIRENSLRDQRGEPPLAYPPILKATESQLMRLQAEREQARARPGQIAVALRNSGAALLLGYVLLVWLTRRRRPATAADEPASSS